MVGGNGPKRTLPLVAKYADIWNCQMASPELFQERSALLDELLRNEGRQPGDVKRTVMVPIFTYQDREDFSQQMEFIRSSFGFSPDEDISKWLTENMSAIIGEPDRVIEAIRRYQKAGVEEFIVPWYSLQDFRSLNLIAETILPHFK
jgi:alkanesulfonate monooxygenase SsuD/methylene tetrahydromethanopterin reductase-like flavin-dependent oxidoreductase (luciferase family)